MPLYIHRKIVKLLVGPVIKSYSKKHKTPYSILLQTIWRRL